jgi:hypothetical protein
MGQDIFSILMKAYGYQSKGGRQERNRGEIRFGA